MVSTKSHLKLQSVNAHIETGDQLKVGQRKIPVKLYHLVFERTNYQQKLKRLFDGVTEKGCAVTVVVTYLVCYIALSI